MLCRMRGQVPLSKAKTMNQNGFNLIQYTRFDGIRNFSDSYIKQLFKRMQSEGLVERVFPGGSIKTSDEFLHVMKYGQCKLFLIFCDSEIAGITWLTEFKHRSAVAHFCSFKRAQGEKTWLIAKKVLNELLYMKDLKGYIFDVLLGMIPSNNEIAVKFAQKYGMIVVGEIPNAIWDDKLQKSIAGVMLYAIRSEGI